MKNSRLTILPLLFTFIALLLSCSEEGTYDNHYSLSPESFFEILQMPEVFDGEGGRDTIRIKTNLPWKAVPNETWMTVSPSSGVGSAIVTVTSEKNELPELRAGEIVFGNRLWLDKNSSSDEVNDMLGIVTIKQSPTLEFSLSADTLFFTPQSDRKSVSITSNLSWEASTRVYWFTLSKTSGEGDGTLVVEATENTSIEKREGTITFKSLAGFSTLTIVQEGVEPVFEVDPDTLSFTYKSTSAVLTVTSNQSWKVSTDDSWLSLSSTGDMYGPIVSVQATENTTSTSREGAVTFTAGDSTYVVPVTQAARTLSVDTESLTFTSAGGSQTVTVEGDTPFDVTSEADWLTLDIRGTSVVVKAAANASITEREAQIIVSASGLTEGTISQTITVTQEAAAPTFSVTPTSATFTSSGGNKTLTVTSNQAWTASSDAAWLTLSETSGTGNATLSVTAETNNATSSRSGTVTFKAGGTSYTVSISQEGAASTFSVTPTSASFTSSGGSVTLTITSNQSWTASTSATWLTLSNNSGMGDATLTITAEVNPSISSRTEAIAFTAGGTSYRVSVTQDGATPTFSITPTSASFTSSGGNKTLTVTSNQSWTVSSDVTWLSLSDSSGSGDVTLTVTVSANTSINSRFGTITFKAGGTSYEVSISQSGAAATFGVTPTSAEFSADGGSKSLTITSNQTWTASASASWILLSNNSGNGNATFTVTASANTFIDGRSGEVTFEAGGVPYTVSVTQAGATPTFSITPTSTSFSSTGGNKTLTITSNQSWTVSSDVTWLSLSKTSGTGDGTLTVTAESNSSAGNRSGEVTFVAGGTTFSVSITQTGTGERKPYLTFEAIENTTFTFSRNDIQYSIDGGATWTKMPAFTSSPTIQAGERIMWKASGLNPPQDTGGIGTFGSSGNFNVEGNVMSLMFGDDFIGKTNLSDYDYAFSTLFYDCRGLISAKDLELPAITLASHCYNRMFSGCISLTASPVLLPATTLTESCYQYMFEGCTSLDVAPRLSAVALAQCCCVGMFSGCTSLAVAPELQATTMAPSCYQYMFSGCTSLFIAPKLPATRIAGNCYYGMFSGCTNLTIAPELPATTLTTLDDFCYTKMFAGCTALTTAPSILPATTLASNCYSYMFQDCTSLTTTPELPATSLTSYCYYRMFAGCTSLTSAPELPATTLAYECYSNMFYGCSSLNYIKCLATEISAHDCTEDWVKGVASTGTFVKAASMSSWTIGDNGIPNGWKVQGDSPFSVTPTSVDFSAAGGTNTLIVTSDLSWTVSSDVTWLTLSKTSGTGDGTLTLTAESNSSAGNRSGEVTFVAGGTTYTVSISQKGRSDSGTHAYVDLGLPSGLLWATCNVGANSPEEYGDYFAWGETITKSNYNLSTYKWCNGSEKTLTKYNTFSSYGTVDNKTVLDLEDDAAHVNWGGGWRMPTKDDWDELFRYCSYDFTTQGGHWGFKVKSKSNNSIFLPAAGFRYSGNLDHAGSIGLYWSSSLDSSSPDCARYFVFDAYDCIMSFDARAYGRSVRPVYDESTPPMPTFALSANEISFTSSGGSEKIMVTSNQSWIVSGEYAPWLTFSKTSGTGDATLTISAEANTSTSSRTHLITFEAGGETYTVSVIQAGATPTFSVTPTSIYFTSTGESKTLTINSSQSWTASSNVSWASLSSSSGTGNATLTLTAETNTTSGNRSGTVTFTAGGKNYTINVTQEGSDYFFNATPTTLYFDSSGGNDSITISTNLSSWTVTTSDTWITLPENSGRGDDMLPFFVKANTSTGRSGYITFSTGGSTYQITVVQDAAEQLMIDGHEYVDLGLPSGTLWATCNIGASTPHATGYYYLWGETDGYSGASYFGGWKNYKFSSNGDRSSLNKYNTDSSYGIVDNKTVLDLNDDAAFVNWGGEWHIPTKTEWNELLTECIWTEIIKYFGSYDSYEINYKITSKKNGKSIILPNTGEWEEDGSSGQGELIINRESGAYWSSTMQIDTPYYAWGLSFVVSGYPSLVSFGRCSGCCIRPVHRP